MGTTILNHGSAYAKLVWPIDPSTQHTRKPNLYSVAPLFEHVNVSLKKIWLTLCIHS